MAQLRAKQIKLAAAGDLLIGGAGGNGTILTKGTEGQVLKIIAGGNGLAYADNTAADISFAPAGDIAATTVQDAIAEVAADAATALSTAIAGEVTARDAAIAAVGNALDARLDTAEGDIAGLQAELDATQLSAGFTNSSYGTNTGTNYLDGATSLKGADLALDAAIKELANDLAGLAGGGSGTSLASLQTEVNNIETAVGLNGDGTFDNSGYAGSTHSGVSDTATNTVKGKILAVDAALTAEELARSTADTALGGRIDGTVADISDLQDELTATQTGAGLAADGTYTVHQNTRYIGTLAGGLAATSLHEADKRLADGLGDAVDANVALSERLSITQDRIGINFDGSTDFYSSGNYIVQGNAESGEFGEPGYIGAEQPDNHRIAIGKLDAALGLVSGELNVTQAGAGLEATGAYVADVASNYLDAATSLKNADLVLDGVIKGLADDLAALELAQGGDLAALQTEVNNIETGLGFGADGVKPAFTSVNYVSATDSVVTAVNKLDAQAKVNANDIDALDARITALGAAFNYVGVVTGGADAASATDLALLPTGGKDAGDYYKVTTAGFFKVGEAGVAFYVNTNDGLIFNTTGGVDVIDNSNSQVQAGANISVTGNTDTGYTVALSGIVPVANGGTGVAELGDLTSVDNKITVTGGTGAVVTDVTLTLNPANIDFSTLGQVGTPTDGRFLRWNGTTNQIEYVTAAQLGATIRAEEDFAPATAANAEVTLANVPTGDIQVFINGVKLKKAGYSLSGSTVTLIDSANGYGIEAGDTLAVSYSYAA